jgi:hypothetical protein
MSSTIFLDILMTELQNLTEEEVSSAMPTEEVQEGEVTLGFLHPKVRRLYTLRKKFQNQAEDWMNNQRQPRTEEDLHSFLQEAESKATRIDILANLFWFSVREQISRAKDKSEIGLRKDWQIVWCKKKEEARHQASEELLQALRRMME